MRLLGVDDAGAGANRERGSQIGVRGHLVTGCPTNLIKQGFEICAVTLETCGIYVSQVVGNDLHAGLLRIQAGLGNVHRTGRHLSSPRRGLLSYA